MCGLLGSPAAGQEAPAATPLERVRQALDQARASGAIARFAGEQHFRLEREWIGPDGRPAREPTRALLRVRAYEGGEGFTLEVTRWSPDAVEPTQTECVLGGEGLIRWGEVRPGWRQAATRRVDPRFLPAELVEWVIPLLWDQGLPAVFAFRQRADALADGVDAAQLQLDRPRAGETRATVVVLDAEVERVFEVSAGGADAGRLLAARSASLFADGGRAPRWRERREPLSPEAFRVARQAWRTALLESRLQVRLVHGQTGEPVPGVLVRLRWPGGELREATSSSRGRVHLPFAEAGRYGIALRGRGFHGFTHQGRAQRVSEPQTLLDGRRTFEFELLTVTLDAAQARQGLELVLWPAVEVRGVVRSPRGRPVVGASVRYGPGPRELRHLTETDREGQFRLQAAPGTLRLVVSDPRWQTAVETCEVGAETPRLEVRLAAGGEVQGRVLSADGAPLAGALVEALGPGAEDALGIFDPSRGGRRVADTTDMHGRYLLRGVPPGHVVLRASRLGSRPQALPSRQVVAGEVVEQRFDLAPGGGVAARLVGPDGAALTVDGVVVFGPIDGPRVVTADLFQQGSFFVEEPRIGRYWLRVEAEGYRPRQLDDVEAGTRGLELRLEPK